MSYEHFMSGFESGQRSSPKATSPFLVFADAIGFKAPTFKHPTRVAAESEAERLATLNPGVNYYVMGALSISSATKPSASTRKLV